MPEFLELAPPEEALEVLLENLDFLVKTETQNYLNVLDRITAENLIAPSSLPSFTRSTVDGFAVRAPDIHGASESLPVYLTIVGEILMGEHADITLHSSQCVLIHTGGMLPKGADAVVMVEDTQYVDNREIEILKSLAAGDNVIQIGEDVKNKQQIIKKGTRIRPSELGGLCALGVTEIPVIVKPRIGIISSGDEIISPSTNPLPGQVRDINTYTLSSLITKNGGEPDIYDIVPDNFDQMYKTAKQALSDCDMVVVTAGSSASTRDLTAQVIDKLGKPGVLVHGVNIRPGKPTILGICDQKPVIGLPGNPVSALVVASVFLIPVIDKFLGLRTKIIPYIEAELMINLNSSAGRVDYVAVKLRENENGGYDALPVFGKSNLIFTLARADGLIKIPANSTGIPAGENVKVTLL